MNASHICAAMDRDFPTLIGGVTAHRAAWAAHWQRLIAQRAAEFPSYDTAWTLAMRMVESDNGWSPTPALGVEVCVTFSLADSFPVTERRIIAPRHLEDPAHLRQIIEILRDRVSLKWSHRHV